MLAKLPQDVTVAGIDEHTALVMDLFDRRCHVMGRGTVTILRRKKEQRFVKGQSFSVDELGPFHLPEPSKGVPKEIFERVRAAQSELEARTASQPSRHVLSQLKKRESARKRGDWAAADALRDEIATHGWQIKDTPEGPQLTLSEEEHHRG